MSKLKEFNWLKIYILCLFIFYFIYSIKSLFNYYNVPEELAYTVNNPEYSYKVNWFLYSIFFISFLNIVVFFIVYIFNKIKLIESNKYEMNAIKYFTLLQPIILFLAFEWGVSYMNYFPLIASVVFIVFTYFYYFFSQYLLAKEGSNLTQLKLLFIINDIFFAFSIFCYFQVSLLETVLIALLNSMSTLVLKNKKSFIIKYIVNLLMMSIGFIWISLKICQAPVDYQGCIYLFASSPIIFWQNNKLLMFYDLNKYSILMVFQRFITRYRYWIYGIMFFSIIFIDSID